MKLIDVGKSSRRRFGGEEDRELGFVHVKLETLVRQNRSLEVWYFWASQLRDSTASSKPLVSSSLKAANLRMLVITRDPLWSPGE